jgi:hypothetical protein
VVPFAALLNSTGVIADAEQIVCDVMLATAFGMGFTNTVVVMGVPEQVAALGVTVNVTVTGAEVVLVKVPVILPVPLDAMPVTATVLFLVQL